MHEGSAHNGWFLDYEAGGIYFNVLANGQPYEQARAEKVATNGWLSP